MRTDTERLWKRVEDEIRLVADQLVYQRQREWSGFWGINRLKLRNAIAQMAIDEARVAVRRFMAMDAESGGEG